MWLSLLSAIVVACLLFVLLAASMSRLLRRDLRLLLLQQEDIERQRSQSESVYAGVWFVHPRANLLIAHCSEHQITYIGS